MNSKIISPIKKTLVFVVAMGLMFACGPDKKKESSASAEFDEAAQEVKEQVEKIIYDIPSPSEIPYIIQSTGAEYNPSIINPSSKYDAYTLNAKRAAFNLGVYSTDIGYLSSYSKTQEALNYMDVCLKMSESIGIQDAIDLDVLQRFEKNLSNTDSLAKIIDEAINNSDKYLQQNDRNNIAALILGGSFIESLYIATQIIDTYPKDLLPDDARMTILTPLIRLLSDQTTRIGDMVKLLKSVEEKDEWIHATINSMEELHASYVTFDPEGKIAAGRGNEILNDEVLKNLTNQISSIRKNIVYAN